MLICTVHFGQCCRLDCSSAESEPEPEAVTSGNKGGLGGTDGRPTMIGQSAGL